jgi:hypothetical protein
MAEETFYRDQILCMYTIVGLSGDVTDSKGIANAAVLFPDTFRIVLRAKKADGRQTYEAVLVRQ